MQSPSLQSLEDNIYKFPEKFLFLQEIFQRLKAHVMFFLGTVEEERRHLDIPWYSIGAAKILRRDVAQYNACQLNRSASLTLAI